MMGRFSSIEHYPVVTRSNLRDRFERYLTSDRSGSHPHVRVGRDVTLSDESMLGLLLNLRIDFASDVDSVRATYNSALSVTSNEPSLDEVIDAGWLTVVWGRISAPHDLVRAAEGATPPLGALCSLLKRRFDETYRVKKTSSRPELDDVTTRIRNKELRPEQIGCQSPDWVAARLWDRISVDCGSRPTALRVWFDRWEKLGRPSFVPHIVWEEHAQVMFREAVFTVLESDPGICGWKEARDDLIKKYALLNNEHTDTIAARVPDVPDSMVDRVSWVFDVTDHNRMREHEEVEGLVSLLLSDAETENNAAAPHPVVKRLIDLAKKRADLFLVLVFQLSGSSRLLADLLLDPATAAVACMLIAKWQFSSCALDRDVIRDNQTAKSMAFADAVSVLGHFLAQDEADPQEGASLLKWFYQSIPYGVADHMEIHDSLLTTLRREFSQQPRRVLRAMVDALLASDKSELKTSKLVAAVDIVNCGNLEDEVDPMPFVDAYARLVGSNTSTLLAAGLTGTIAAALLKIATRAPQSSFRRFLCPIDTRARLDEGSEDDRYSIEYDLGRSIRVHIRTMSSGISSYSGPVPEAITNALIFFIRTGALARPEKGRIAAFSPQYEESGSDDHRGGRPIAANLGSVICTLSGKHRKRVLAAVIETDEPMILAQLLAYVPHSVRSRIRDRIEELTPSEAGEVYSLTHAQARIETLLSAGLADAAERFIRVEPELQTLGTVAGRVVTRLRARLRLHFLRDELKEIEKYEVPTNLTKAEQRSAAQAINFYKGLARLHNPKGDRQAAEKLFSHLHRERPDIFAYFVNLFAVRICILLEDDTFKLLCCREMIVRGRRLLEDTEKRIHQFTTISEDDADIYACNKAQLLVALDEPQQAIDLLASINTPSLRDTAAAYSAVALARLNRASEAEAVLKQATLTLGESDVLRATRDHLEHSRPYLGEVIVSSGDDTIGKIKAAFFDLNRMDHVGQAKVFSPSGSADEFVISHVRSAAASVTELVPMMRNIRVDSYEDDLNALFKELLTQRLELLGWSVGDQSKGGYTAKGNPGERDMVLRIGATTIAIIEGVKCRDRQSARRANIVSHFLSSTGLRDLSPVFFGCLFVRRQDECDSGNYEGDFDKQCT